MTVELGADDGRSLEAIEGAVDGRNEGITEAVIRRRLAFACLAASTDCCSLDMQQIYKSMAEVSLLHELLRIIVNLLFV